MNFSMKAARIGERDSGFATVYSLPGLAKPGTDLTFSVKT
jgi:hypothetical protein